MRIKAALSASKAVGSPTSELEMIVNGVLYSCLNRVNRQYIEINIIVSKAPRSNKPR